MNIFNTETFQFEKNTLSGLSENILNLSYDQIDKLPTINQVINLCKAAEQKFIISGNREKLNIGAPPMIFCQQMGLNNPFAAYANNGTNDDFVVTKLGSGRFSLKPNLTLRPFLYRGQNTFYPEIISGFNRSSKEEKMIANLKFAELNLLLKTHPLFRMFDGGINLKGYRNTIFFEMNYYGLAQHYGFNTGLLDFSSDIEVSAFFAVSKWLGADKYQYFNDPKIPYGVIFQYVEKPQVTFSIEGFSTIGLQVFPRSGVQKGFFQDSKKSNINFNTSIFAIPFRHDPVENKKIFDKWKGGKLLFPDDQLSSLSKIILNSKEISLYALAHNLYLNPHDNEQKNRERIHQLGYNINPNLRHVFTKDLLETYYEDIKNGWWQDFCSKIYWGDNEKAKVLKEQMSNLPNDIYYRQYFNKNDYECLYYHQIDEEDKANRNHRKQL